MRVTYQDEELCLPDFMILGAAKSGTTSLFQYLAQHPGIYLPSEWKEPGHFCFAGRDNGRPQASDCDTDPKGMWRSVVSGLEEYAALFTAAPVGALLGEATPEYLLLPEPTTRNIDRVYRDQADALRFVVILRNPVDRLWSHYWMMLRDGYEGLSFEKAISESITRQRSASGWHPAYDYLAYGMYGRQLSAYLDRFDRTQIFVVLYENFASDPAAVCSSIYEFLGVDATFQSDVSIRYNYSGALRHPNVHRLLFGGDNVLKRVVRSLIPSSTLQSFKAKMLLWNCRKVSMSTDVRKCMLRHYIDDIRLLEGLIGRDLSAWRVT